MSKVKVQLRIMENQKVYVECRAAAQVLHNDTFIEHCLDKLRNSCKSVGKCCAYRLQLFTICRNRRLTLSNTGRNYLYTKISTYIHINTHFLSTWKYCNTHARNTPTLTQSTTVTRNHKTYRDIYRHIYLPPIESLPKCANCEEKITKKKTEKKKQLCPIWCTVVLIKNELGERNKNSRGKQIKCQQQQQQQQINRKVFVDSLDTASWEIVNIAEHPSPHTPYTPLAPSKHSSRALTLHWRYQQVIVLNTSTVCTRVCVCACVYGCLSPSGLPHLEHAVVVSASVVISTLSKGKVSTRVQQVGRGRERISRLGR